jgi:hypothetical protein
MASILALLATLAVLHVPPHRPEENEAEEEVPSLAVTT